MFDARILAKLRERKAGDVLNESNDAVKLVDALNG